MGIEGLEVQGHERLEFVFVVRWDVIEAVIDGRTRPPGSADGPPIRRRLHPVELTPAGHFALAEEGDVAGDGGFGDAGQRAGPCLGFALADESEDFHPLLHAWVGVLVPLGGQGTPIIGRERQCGATGHRRLLQVLPIPPHQPLPR